MDRLKRFILKDLNNHFYPLHINELLVRQGLEPLLTHLRETIAKPNGAPFQTAPIIYTLKDATHLRQGLLLDPYALLFLYDLVYSSHKVFQKVEGLPRQQYGPAFEGNRSCSETAEIKSFRSRIASEKKRLGQYAQADIANCFNSFYHHDITAFLENTIDVNTAELFGRFLRQINLSRTITCFPQGIYPAKVIGNFFLSFIESSGDLNSDIVLRYIDDIALVSRDLETLRSDMFNLQSALGAHGLSLNAAKTRFSWLPSRHAIRSVGEVRRRLLKRRENMGYGYAATDDVPEDLSLDGDEVKYLHEILQEPDVTEPDVELALQLLLDEHGDFEALLRLVFFRYPSLLRPFFYYTQGKDYGADFWDALWGNIVERVSQPDLHEFELYWLARLIIDRYELENTPADVLFALYRHRNAGHASRSAILENPVNKFGFYEIKYNEIRNGTPSTLLSACAGLRDLPTSQRNQIYRYVGNISPSLHIISEVLETL